MMKVPVRWGPRDVRTDPADPADSKTQPEVRAGLRG